MTLSSFKRSIIKAILFYALLFIIANIIFHFIRHGEVNFAFLPFMAGAMFGAELNVLKILWLEHVVNTITEENSIVSSKYLQIQYLLRWLLTGFIIAFAVIFPNIISVAGVGAGLTTLPLAGYTVGLFTNGKTS